MYLDIFKSINEHTQINSEYASIDLDGTIKPFTYIYYKDEYLNQIQQEQNQLQLPRSVVRKPLHFPVPVSDFWQTVKEENVVNKV